MLFERLYKLFTASLVLVLFTSCTGLRPAVQSPQTSAAGAPTVVMVAPQANGVGTNREIAVVFSQAMNPATINTSTFLVDGVTGTVTYDAVNLIAAFKPLSDFAPSTSYNARITTGATDVNGLALAAPFTFSFATRATKDTSAPIVAAVNVAAGALCVPQDQKIKVTFDEPMDSLTLTPSTFFIDGVAGSVTYDAASQVATFAPAALLAVNTTYTITVTTGAKDMGGVALAAPFHQTFTTGPCQTGSAPKVAAINVAAGATCVPLNQTIQVTFDQPMDATTITPVTFFINGVAGSVSYNSSTKIATFTPTTGLAVRTTYTITVTTGVKSASEVPLAAPFTQTFTTGPCPTAVAPVIVAVNVAAAATCVPLNQKIQVTFNVPMDPLSITPTTFSIDGVSGTVAYDAIAQAATFTPASLAANTPYTITVTTGVKSVEGVNLAAPFHQTFTTGPCTGGGPAPVILCTTVGDFVVLAGSTVTNTGSTVISGSIGVSPGTAVTGFPPGLASGTIHSADGAAALAQVGLTTAYNDAAGRSGGVTVSGDLVGQTLTAGVYKSASSLAVSGNVTLDGQGNPNAVFIFQIGSSLTTASGSHIILINGATACNVFWQVGSSATLGTNSVFMGNIMALTSITLTTGASMEGRALARNGAVTLDTNTIGGCRCGP